MGTELEHIAMRLQRPRAGRSRGASRHARGSALLRSARAGLVQVGQPGDRYEREADHVAAAVGRAARPARRTDGHSFTGIQTHAPDAQGDPGRARGADMGSSGEPLAPAERRFYEHALGAEFGHVRTHDDTRADELARGLHARAFTLGSDIYFRRGAQRGLDRPQLMAHELTHVVQQGAARPAAGGVAGGLSSTGGPMIQGDFLDALGGIARDTMDQMGTPLDPIESTFDGVVASNRALATAISISASAPQAVFAYAASNPLDGAILLPALARLPSFYRGGWIMDLQPAAAAMTLDHSIFVPSGNTLSLSTYVHELVHVLQYGLLGPTAFLVSYFGVSAATIAYRWARGLPLNPMRSSPHESQAYALSRRFDAWYQSTHGVSASSVTY